MAPLRVGYRDRSNNLVSEANVPGTLRAHRFQKICGIGTIVRTDPGSNLSYRISNRPYRLRAVVPGKCRVNLWSGESRSEFLGRGPGNVPALLGTGRSWIRHKPA
jgi:hypothetical protein